MLFSVESDVIARCVQVEPPSTVAHRSISYTPCTGRERYTTDGLSWSMLMPPEYWYSTGSVLIDPPARVSSEVCHAVPVQRAYRYRWSVGFGNVEYAMIGRPALSIAMSCTHALTPVLVASYTLVASPGRIGRSPRRPIGVPSARNR